MRVRAVLFDLFDTLVDLRIETLPKVEIGGRTYAATYRRLHDTIVQRTPLAFEPFASALVEVDRSLRDEYYGQGRELPTRTRFRALLDHLDLEDDGLAEELTEVHMGALRQHAFYLDHHVEVLQSLAQQAKLAVVSNFSHSPTALSILDEAGLTAHLEAIVISDQGGIRKPRPEIFHEALGKLGVEPADTLHVGDNLAADVGGADGVGMRSVWLTRRVADPERTLDAHEGASPSFVVADLNELPDLLGRVA